LLLVPSLAHFQTRKSHCAAPPWVPRLALLGADCLVWVLVRQRLVVRARLAQERPELAPRRQVPLERARQVLVLLVQEQPPRRLEPLNLAACSAPWALTALRPGST
jgi:hypothetical protein